MKRIIEIKGRTGRFDVPSFAVTENEKLTIEFRFDKPSNGRYIASFLCGNAKKVVTLDKTLSATLSPEFFAKGEYRPVHILLEMRSAKTDKVLISNEPAEGGYFIEPLFLDTVAQNTTAYAWLTSIEKSISAIVDRLLVVENKLKEFEEEGVPLVAATEYTNEKE